MLDEKLIIGMPAGSLADPGRGGNLIQLLKHAGFTSKGYETGGPTEFSSMNFLFGWDGRPQEFGSQLGIDELDVAIAGCDWIQERILELKLEYNTDIEIEEVLSLNRGGVRIVGIASQENEDTVTEILERLCKTKNIITVAAEMPYIALSWIQSRLKDIGKFEEFSAFSVQKYKTIPKIDKGIVIYETWGKTEAKVKNSGTDLGIEITQSGSAIRNYRLKIIDEIMVSHTGIFISPKLKTNEKKSKLLKMFLLNLYGSVNAEHKVMILFNVPNNSIQAIEAFLKENNLYADEPTISQGKTHTQFSIQVDTKQHQLSLAQIRFELALRNAVNIDTLPINSSIPSIKVLGF